MAVAARALIDVDYYGLATGVDVNQVDFPTDELESAIMAATDAIEQRCIRSFISPSAAVDEIFGGTGSESYIVNEGRINSATTPILYYWSATAWTTASTTSYPREYDYPKGEVYFTNGGVFWTGKRNWKIEYKSGWADIAALPDDLKRACVDLVEYMRLSTKKIGVGSETFGDNSVSYLAGMNKVVAAAWPLTITTVLDKYRMVTFG